MYFNYRKGISSCPVYNELIREGGRILVYPGKYKTEEMGTPEDLQNFFRKMKDRLIE